MNSLNNNNNNNKLIRIHNTALMNIVLYSVHQQCSEAGYFAGARADKTLIGSATVYTRDALKNNNTKLYLNNLYFIFDM